MNDKKSEGIPNELARELSAWVNSWVPVWEKKAKSEKTPSAPDKKQESKDKV